MVSRWLNRERLAALMWATGWTLATRLPESAVSWLGHSAADLVHRRNGPGVRRLKANLAQVTTVGPELLEPVTRAAVRSYARYWTEALRLSGWSRKRIRDSFAPEGLHHLTDALAAGRGVVLVLPHTANWDLAGAWVATHLRVPFTTVAERLKPDFLFNRFIAHRTSLGMEVLPHDCPSTFPTLLRRLRQAGLVILLADRDLSSSGVEVEFFGSPARMPTGPAVLAQRTGALLLPVMLWYDDGPVMRGRVFPPLETSGHSPGQAVRKVTQAMADHFAAGIAQHPQDWHMLQRLWTH
ncbi:phosphatidylinositol mannoside acyltransferase [Streptomyces sp. NPDC098789]|uniref:phosphatidylinositol mannoside acyltransferase n=1 Tax=Streptomyces sp. NPDC098789 TaxID=3366098 RepID=UPI00381EF9F7